MIKISVIVCTFNPDINRLGQTLIGLKKQTFPITDWELILVDNNSSTPFTSHIDIGWHQNVKVVKEPKAGLTYARIKGFQESKGDFIVMVDDDNILTPDYLMNVYTFFLNHKNSGAIGGKSLPLFDFDPPYWLKYFHTNLALRNHGEEIVIEKWENTYPKTAPIGAGMGIRKSALNNYINKIKSGKNKIVDRQGTSLSSGGDNDIVIEILKAGWDVAYVPLLSLNHIIPVERTTKTYLARLNRDSTKSWVTLLNEHKINPWSKIPKWSVPLRKMKAWFIYKPWQSELNFIRFNGTCGLYEVLSELDSTKK